MHEKLSLKEIKKYRLYCAELSDIEISLKSSKCERSTVGLLYRKNELERKIEAINQFVKCINNYKVKRALYIYCIEPINENADVPDWESVANRIGNGCTEASVKMAVKRFFTKNS